MRPPITTPGLPSGRTLGHGLGAAVVVLVVGAACHAPTTGLPPVAGSCAANRIGAVVVTGAPRRALAPLTVLEGTLDDPARTARIAELATEGLRAAGHARAMIDVTRAVGAGGCGIDLTAHVSPGPRFQIRAIEFQTEDTFPAGERLAVIEDALGTVNTVGGTYIAYRLTRALPELRRRYVDAGWVGVEIGAPQAIYGARGDVEITVPIKSGPRFTIGTIRAIGAGAAARAQVLDALGLREGSYYDRSSVRAGVERAQRMLDRRINLRVQVAPDRTEIDVDAIVEAP